MPKFKTTEKIKEVEIVVKPFEEIIFIIGADCGDKLKHNVVCFSECRDNFISTIEGRSHSFKFEEKTQIKKYCQQAYDRLIKNVEKFVEENG